MIKVVYIKLRICILKLYLYTNVHICIKNWNMISDGIIKVYLDKLKKKIM